MRGWTHCGHLPPNSVHNVYKNMTKPKKMTKGVKKYVQNFAPVMLLVAKCMPKSMSIMCQTFCTLNGHFKFDFYKMKVFKSLGIFWT